jgi:glycosyltransferase involved in cell wall biosynthesis
VRETGASKHAKVSALPIYRTFNPQKGSSHSMDILEIGYPFIPVPPTTGYGPTEAVISCITEEMVKAGHHVTLWAPEGSYTAADFMSCGAPTSLQVTAQEWRSLRDTSSAAAYQLAYERGVDIIHDHTEFTDYQVPAGRERIPVIRTVHKPASMPGALEAFQAMSRAGDAFVAISARQRDLFVVAAAQSGNGPINFVGVVHNPIDLLGIPFQPVKRDTVLFLGRCDVAKAPDSAIRVARDAGKHLVLALKVVEYEQDEQNRRYYWEVVKPLIDAGLANGTITLLGEISQERKLELLGEASAVLFTSGGPVGSDNTWEEPFGLVLTEAMAAGTPVLAFNKGSASEIIAQGITGWVCDTEAEMTEALKQVHTLDPHNCRAHVQRYFSPAVAAQGYLAAFERVLAATHAMGPAAN